MALQRARWARRSRRPAPRDRDAGSGVRDLRHRVLPAELGRAAHHEQVPGAGCEVARRSARLRLDEERAAGAEREDRDDRVVEPAQLAVAVRRDAVAPVAVVVERRARSAARRTGPRARPAPRRARGGARWSARCAKQVSRGSSTIRSYIQRRPCCHSTRLDELDQQRVAAAQPPGREVDPRAIVEPGACRPRRPGSTAGGPAPSREIWCGAAACRQPSEQVFAARANGPLRWSRTP